MQNEHDDQLDEVFYRASGDFVVTSSVFTDEARRFAEGREIERME